MQKLTRIGLVCVSQYSRLSKQYGMEIFLKKEHLHYTGSVKERGVLYVLTSLNQVCITMHLSMHSSWGKVQANK